MHAQPDQLSKHGMGNEHNNTHRGSVTSFSAQSAITPSSPQLLLPYTEAFKELYIDFRAYDDSESDSDSEHGGGFQLMMPTVLTELTV